MDPQVTARVYRCAKCGYHYPPNQMDRYTDVRYSERDRYFCKDEARCNANIARREADREALKR